MSIELRPAAPEDLDQVVEVFLDCWRRSYAEVMPAAVVDSMSDDQATALWRRALSSEEARTVVAEEGARILGVTRFDDSGSPGAVHSLYVSPDARGRGLGTTLLGHAVAAFEKAGLASATLWVFADNAPSIGFYRSQGWLPDGQTRVEPEFGVPELRLRKKIGA